MELNTHQLDLLRRITVEKRNPVCIHILGQSLADNLCEIIRYQQDIIEEYRLLAKEVADQLRSIKEQQDGEHDS